jgi:hypothetical protein
MHSKPVRTYLDPDAVGPLPRAVVADDSDALALARTVVRLPPSPTQEIQTNDLLEVVDPNRRPSSLAPVGYDASVSFLPRRQLGGYVIGSLAVAGLLLVVALVRSMSTPDAPATRAEVAPTATHAAAVAAIPAPPPLPTAEATVGTLRLDPNLEGQRVYLDGVVLKATAAMLRCGAHTFAVGSPARARIVDVPCGGDITVFR